MNGILGMNRILLDTDLQPDQRECVQTVQACSEGLLRLLNDILDFSKMESGRLEIESVDCDLVAVLQGLIDLMKPIAMERGLSLALELPDPRPGVLYGDQVRIRQIISNCITNALKFTERGGVTVSLDWAPVPLGAKGLVRINVRDTGIGMSPEQASRMFQRFEQGDISIGRKYGGTGLGLAICRMLADLMGGRVGVSSKPGQGSWFWLELEMRSARQTIESPVAPRAIQPAHEMSYRVLLAEDNRVNRKVASSLLEKMGCYGDFAGDGTEVLLMITVKAFDVILMDCHMPIMDGYEATRQLRQRGCRIPVIALTAAAMPSEREACRSCGMDDFLAKPFHPEDLQRIISHWGEKKASGHAPSFLPPQAVFPVSSSDIPLR